MSDPYASRRPQPAGPQPVWPTGPQPGPRPKTISILALVFGAVAIPLGFVPVIGILIGGLFAAAAIVLGILGIVLSHRTMAVAGIALAAFGAVLAFVVTTGVFNSENPAATAENEGTTEPAPTETASAATTPPEDDGSGTAFDFPAFDPVTESGTGDATIDLPALQGIVTITHDDDSYFSVNVVDPEKPTNGDLLVLATAAYQGSTAFGMQSFEQGTQLEVIGEGSWEIVIAPIADAPEPPLPHTSAGDAVFLYSGDATTWAVTHDGESAFAIKYSSGADSGADYTVNEVGDFSGSATVPDGPIIVEVSADGAWTIAPSQ